MALRANSYRTASFDSAGWRGRGGWRTGFGARLVRPAVGIAVAGIVVLGVVLVARSAAINSVRTTAPELGRINQAANQALSQLDKYLRSVNGTEIGVSTLTDQQIARLTARADVLKPSRALTSGSGSGATSSSSSSSSGTVTSSGSSSSGSADTGPPGSGSTGGSDGSGSGSGGDGSGGGGSGSGGDDGGSGGGPGGGGPGGGG